MNWASYRWFNNTEARFFVWISWISCSICRILLRWATNRTCKGRPCSGMLLSKSNRMGLMINCKMTWSKLCRRKRREWNRRYCKGKVRWANRRKNWMMCLRSCSGRRTWRFIDCWLKRGRRWETPRRRGNCYLTQVIYYRRNSSSATNSVIWFCCSH
jgi:hypothetical protein